MRAMLMFLIGLTALASCRKDIEQDASLRATAEAVWYDSFGEPGVCEPPADACPSTLNAQGYVDLCVKEGHRAKTCGCLIKCSGRVTYGPITIADQQRNGKEPRNEEATCPQDSLGAIETLRQAAAADSALAACADDFLCKGRLRGCAGPALPAVERLREMAGGVCRDQVVSAFCDADFVDSLQCESENIRKLADAYAKGIAANGPMKACLQAVICSNRDSECSPAQARDAAKIRDLLRAPGCTYWYKSFCRL